MDMTSCSNNALEPESWSGNVELICTSDKRFDQESDTCVEGVSWHAQMYENVDHG